jgi:hypothetical protein
VNELSALAWPLEKNAYGQYLQQVIREVEAQCT